MPLPEVDALGSSLVRRVGRDRVKLCCQLLHKRRDVALPPADLLQPIDEGSTFAIGLLEQTLENQSQATGPIFRCALCKGGDLGKTLLRRDLPWSKTPNQVGDRRIGAPIAEILQWRSVPICSCSKMRHESLLAGPIRVLGL